jgi:hypothetical protein
VSGGHLSKFARGEFVAWDGEGIGRGRRHQYVMFASSISDTIIERRGLGTRCALDYFLAGVIARPRAVHVGFAISYDVNMILRDVPKSVLAQLWAAERVAWVPPRARTRYVLEYRPRKYFRVTREARGVRVTGTWWDVWPFFQSSFVKALEKYGVESEDFRDRIRAMKVQRSGFRARDLAAMSVYNRDECTALVQLMGKLLTSLKAAGLTITRWDGPGAIAAALLEKHQFRDAIAAPVPDAALTAFQHAYYGGRIECAQYGHTRRKIYHYDVNSAYPAAMRTLPCRRPECGRWVYTDRATIWPRDRFACYRVRWALPRAALHPFPWRSAKGSVYFPPAGAGWVWSPELHAARTLRGVTVLGSWRWVKARACRHGGACTWIDALYAERNAAKLRGDGAEHAIKLGLNSLYGKLAQRVGARWDMQTEAWRSPPYFDMAGAGWITSTVRAQLYTAAMQAPGRVLMLATDGIYALVPLQLDTPTDKVLGAWSYERHTGATIVQSGVYILDNADGSESAYTRGFDIDSIDRAAILRGWHRGRVIIPASHERFIGLGAALHGAARWRLWRTWTREARDLSLHPWGSKRTPVLARGKRTPGDASKGLLRTTPTDTARFWRDVIGGHGRMTTPAPIPWRDGTTDALREIDAVDRADAESEDATL